MRKQADSRTKAQLNKAPPEGSHLYYMVPDFRGSSFGTAPTADTAVSIVHDGCPEKGSSVGTTPRADSAVSSVHDGHPEKRGTAKAGQRRQDRA